MRHYLTTITTSLICFTLGSQTLAGDLVIQVEGLTQLSGKVVITLCGSPKCFDDTDNKPGSYYAMSAQTIENDHPSFTFTNITEGDYAAFVFHDMNNNDDFDVSLFGKPKEPYGYSNKKFSGENARFNTAKFSVPDTGKVTHRIELAIE